MCLQEGEREEYTGPEEEDGEGRWDDLRGGQG